PRRDRNKPSDKKRSASASAPSNLIVQFFLRKTERRIAFKIRISRKGFCDAIVIVLKNSWERAKKPGCEERALCFGEIESEFLYFNICRHFRDYTTQRPIRQNHNCRRSSADSKM